MAHWKCEYPTPRLTDSALTDLHDEREWLMARRDMTNHDRSRIMYLTTMLIHELNHRGREYAPLCKEHYHRCIEAISAQQPVFSIGQCKRSSG